MPVGSHGSLSVVGEVMSLCDNLQTFILHIFKDNLNIFSFILWKTESYRNCLTNSPISQVSCWAQAVPSMVLHIHGVLYPQSASLPHTIQMEKKKPNIMSPKETNENRFFFPLEFALLEKLR